MKVINTLKDLFWQHHLGLTRYRIDLISRLILTLVQVRSVNLRKLAAALPGKAKVTSHYRRLQRFFSSDTPPEIFTRLIAQKLIQPGKRILLVMDRTHWQLGKTNLNLLCLGILFQGVSIPLEHLSLGKAGNAKTHQRKRLISRVLKYMQVCSICLLADREFIGKDWFKYLNKRCLDFVIRMRCNTLIHLEDGRLRQLGQFAQRMPKGTVRYYPNTTIYSNLSLNLICYRPQTGDPVLLITNKEDLDDVLRLYRKRWSIETAFACLKSRGFNLEDTHITLKKRLALLLGILAFCLYWVLLIGTEQHRQQPIEIKKHGRRAISFFRLGLDRLQHCLANLDYRLDECCHYCHILLSRT